MYRSPIQLIGGTCVSIPAVPERPARQDYEYWRCGTLTLFALLDAHEPWRRVKVTE